MLDINMGDVKNILNNCKPYLIFFGVVLLLAIIAMVACKKIQKHKKYLVRTQAGIAIVLALIIAVNLICFGPMSTILTLASGKGTITEESSKEANKLCENIAEEGIVLLENKDNILPLQDKKKLNVFGWASTNPCYGGTGSGSLSGAYPTVSLLEGLENAGFTLNKELEEFYKKYREDRPVVGMFEQDWTLPEPPANTYTDDLVNSAKEFSDIAMVVITRVGGEGADLPTDLSKVNFTDNTKDYKDFPEGTHFLELTQSEKDMLNLVCSNFENVVVVYNGANAMELGFIKEYSQIKGAVWCPGTGQSGFNGLGNILSGSVNPSGKTSDTFVADLTDTPYYNNSGEFVYENMKDYKGENFGNETTPTFLNYTDNIYVGYRFYETAAEEGLINYDEKVLYPFGYGLSYTEFTQEMGKITEKNGTVSFDVTVKNTGDTAGKDVVEVYYNPPYKNKGIEKASVNLVAFEKTEVLEPGASQVVNISFNLEDMASYDEKGSGSYVLEAGDYGISIRKDSHTIIEEKKYKVSNTIVYNEKAKRSTDEAAAVNQFADSVGKAEYLSRADKFANYAAATAAPKSFELEEEYKKTFLNNSNYKPEDYNNDSDEMPTTGAKNDLKLEELRGADFNDEKWDKLLDQLTVDEMNTLIAMGGYQTSSVSSVDKQATIDCDGPASINNNFTGVGSIGFPSGVMIACTWNKSIAEQFGESIGKMADEMGVSGWYAPAMNTHRSAFAGRNFEYYSEDGLLAGKIAAKAVIGAEKYGVYAYIKHFALNDQEANRCNMLCTWSTEQAIREIYLKPFELAVKEGGAKAVMSSFNYIGTTYAGAHDALLNKVLRDEWGFRGFVLTDYFAGYGYQNSDQQIRNGNDICLASYDVGTNYVKDKKSATSIQAMRQASKNIMYTVVNSRAYNEKALAESKSTPIWKMIAIGVDIALAVILIAVEVTIVRKGYIRRKEDNIL